MRIAEVISALEQFAPLPLQDSYDNAGLQTGLTDAEVAGALLCLDVTEDVVDEAIASGCNLIVSHHPLLFRGLKRIAGRSYIECCVIKAIKHDIVICSMHTNMDNAPSGVSFRMASKLGLEDVHVLEPREDSLLKLVTYVPTAQAAQVRDALFAAGCGCIGRYDRCSYNIAGQGTYRAGAGTHPFIGTQGEYHWEDETRVEVVMPSYLQGRAVSALLDAHPYEEPAYDLVKIQNSWSETGAGIIGTLPQGIAEADFLRAVKTAFRAGCVRHTKLTGRMVRRVALCGGAGAFLIDRAVAAGADAFVTGEIKYHEFFGHGDNILLADIGHYESEQYTTEIFREIIKEHFPELPVRVTSVDTNPIKYL